MHVFWSDLISDDPVCIQSLLDFTMIWKNHLDIILIIRDSVESGILKVSDNELKDHPNHHR